MKNSQMTTTKNKFFIISYQQTLLAFLLILTFFVKGIELMSKNGLSVHPDTAAVKSKELGNNHDENVKQWMQSIVDMCVLACLSEMDSIINEKNYLPSLPSYTCFGSLLDTPMPYNENLSSTEKQQQQVEQHEVEGFSTVDVSSLGLCYHYNPELIVKSIVDALHSNGHEDKGIKKAVDYILTAGKELEEDNHVAIDVSQAIKRAKVLACNDTPDGYQLITDNLDLHLNVRHMSKSNKNKSLHTFNMVAIKDQVSGNHLPDINTRSLADVEISEFLPSSDEVIMKLNIIRHHTNIVRRQHVTIDHFPRIFFHTKK